MSKEDKDSKRRIRMRIELDCDEFAVFNLTPSDCKRIATDLLCLAHKRSHTLRTEFLDGCITLSEPDYIAKIQEARKENAE